MNMRLGSKSVLRLVLASVLGGAACGGSVAEGIDAGAATSPAIPERTVPRGSIEDAAASPIAPPDAAPQRDASPDGGAAGDGATAGVPCGATSCSSPMFCLYCDPTSPAGKTSCETDVAVHCTPWGDYPPLRVSCDGPEDCQPHERCALLEGSLGTYVECLPKTAPSVVCRSLGECPAEAKTCEPYAAGYAVRVCR